jgi:hypothetical protein
MELAGSAGERNLLVLSEIFLEFAVPLRSIEADYTLSLRTIFGVRFESLAKPPLP